MFCSVCCVKQTFQRVQLVQFPALKASGQDDQFGTYTTEKYKNIETQPEREASKHISNVIIIG